MTNEDLLKMLKSTHAKYDAEMAWHRFQMDAYSGCGGFQGSVKQPESSFWGPAADMYSETDGTLGARTGANTYLDQFPREDAPKFARRIQVAHYPNYIAPVMDTKLSYMHGKEFTRRLPPLVDEWINDVDGTGSSMDEVRKKIVDLRAATLGWMPVVIDWNMPVEPGTSLAQAMAMGRKLTMTPLFPANLLDWETDDSGGFSWTKHVIMRRERPDPLGPAQIVSRYYIWTPNSVSVYAVTCPEGTTNETLAGFEERPNPFGEVPIVVFRHKSVTDDPVRGVPMCASSAVQAKRLFNVISEKDEHLRCSVFAMLQVPTDAPDQVGALIGGSGNALPVKTDSARSYEWIAPPPTVYQTLADEEDRLIKSISRTERTELVGDDSTAANASGISRAYKFEPTNQAIGEFARSLADSEAKVYRIVARALGADAENISVVAPTKFGISELASAIQEAIDAVTLDMGPTGNGAIKKRLIDQILPNLQPEERAQIDAEIESMSQTDALDSQLAAELATTPTPDPDEAPDPVAPDQVAA